MTQHITFGRLHATSLVLPSDLLRRRGSRVNLSSFDRSLQLLQALLSCCVLNRVSYLPRFSSVCSAATTFPNTGRTSPSSMALTKLRALTSCDCCVSPALLLVQWSPTDIELCSWHLSSLNKLFIICLSGGTRSDVTFAPFVTGSSPPSLPLLEEDKGGPQNRFGGLSISAEDVSFHRLTAEYLHRRRCAHQAPRASRHPSSPSGLLSIIEARLFALTPMSQAAPSPLLRSVFQILTEHLAVCEILCERRHELCHRSRHRVFETEAPQRLARTAQANRCCS